MEAALDQEAATADLLTDIVAPVLNRPLPDTDVCDLVRGLTSGSDAWRDAWSISHSDVIEETAQIPQGLTREEDDELRRLYWLSQMGRLASRQVHRLLELRIRDRRGEIRLPREVADNYDAAFRALLKRFHFLNATSRPVLRVELDDLDEPMGDLRELRRQLDGIHATRLLRPLNREEASRYKWLLAMEQSLLDSGDA